MYGGNGHKPNYVMILLGLLCFLAASILLHSFKGRFTQEYGEEKSMGSSMPVMEDTINVSGNTSASEQLTEVSPTPGVAVNQDWVIYVTGSVKKPGVYRVPINSRVYQALEIAGGFTAKADQESVNLAAMLEDGAHIRFPAKGETGTAQNQGGGVQPTSQPAKTQVVKTADSAKINLNTADQSKLEELPGFGPKTSQLIIQYRDSNGGFKRVEDLLLVKGIGPKKYDAIKNLVTVER